MIIKKTSVSPSSAVRNNRPAITASVKNRERKPVMSSRMAGLTPEQKKFAMQLQKNYRTSGAITAATNTTNIAARPDFLELLPLFVQKLYLLDVYGSVAMNSRQQLVPYFKFIAENTKGETKAGTVLSSPFVNRQGIDPNFTGRIVRNEVLGEGAVINNGMNIVYTPVLPGSVTIEVTTTAGTVSLVDDGAGNLTDPENTYQGSYIDYSTGAIHIEGLTGVAGDVVTATYQYDNETVGPDVNGEYGAKMAKGYLQLDEINLVAEAREIACYWSVYSAFATSKEWGSDLGDMAKEASFGELTAELNSWGFDTLRKAATYNPQFNWDASPVLSGSVVPSDYLNMFKLKLNNAAAAVYQATRLSRPNRLIVGTNVSSYVSMIDNFVADADVDTVGPYRLGQLDQFAVYVDPNYDPNEWVMCCKSQDIRKNSGLFGEYMPFVSTDAIGLANMSVQQGYATMCAMKVVNPATVVSGRLVGA